ncbi:hypothetical protein CC85DRAFT_284763 [Cutaneotrichosporon oleaginosum]|uniref:Uncharacterized protein n=1 Tax=Cutaneotrichosporon oleaginosum TaxID=879819 RepID=A0A0J0XQ15_9TREE|nr:uncharacterized protein CC85DRAFT_284763 [Cutaneotrichosporon oleaginosum]KLT43205.1 hypothetical protein CC85DRAFT_284763 [Cutaneotrichosporon oleaginosum]TXT09887.1 hypothetical protein COLE_03821 [Cutaneotrichosporon oleaginosum]
MGGDGEGFGSALKSLQDSGLLSPNIIRTLNDKIVGLEERNEKLLRDCRNADRERHEAIKAKEKVEDARMVEHSRAAKEVVRLQEALDVSRDETTLARKQLKDGEIRTREAQAGANAALAAMQVSLDQALQARNVAQQEIARHESTSTAAHEAQAVAEALAAERLTQVSRLTNDLDRTYKELDRLKSARGRLSATANKFKVTTARDSLLGEKLAHSERQSLEFQKRIEKLERELEDQAIAHAFELAEREDAMEIAHSSALAEFVARLDSNKLIEGDKGRSSHGGS